MTGKGFEGVKTAKVNGTSLAYRERGEGEPVVFLHGGITDLRVCRPCRTRPSAQ